MFTKLLNFLHYGINAMYNEYGTCNFFLVTKNPFTTHNIYQYVNKKSKKNNNAIKANKTYIQSKKNSQSRNSFKFNKMKGEKLTKLGEVIVGEGIERSKWFPLDFNLQSSNLSIWKIVEK